MKILLIDTCGATGSITLADTGPSDASPAIIATEFLPGRTASERLVPAINALIAAHGATLQLLRAIAVVHGPGSFTGVRVGVSAAKGLCEALDKPLVAISRLAVLAEMASASTSAPAVPRQAASSRTDPPAARRVHSLLDARRGEFYYGEYAGGVCLREALLTRDELLSAVGIAAQQTEDRVVVACEPAVAESLTLFSPHLVPEPAAANAFPLALQRIREASFDDVATIDANYVRRTDAQIFAKPFAKPKPHVPPARLLAEAHELPARGPETPLP